MPINRPSKTLTSKYWQDMPYLNDPYLWNGISASLSSWENFDTHLWNISIKLCLNFKKGKNTSSRFETPKRHFCFSDFFLLFFGTHSNLLRDIAIFEKNQKRHFRLKKKCHLSILKSQFCFKKDPTVSNFLKIHKLAEKVTSVKSHFCL